MVTFANEDLAMRLEKLGFTKVELAVCMSIVTVLMALLIPAVLRVRESARRTTCENNLRQLGIALQSHEAAHHGLPSLYNGNFRPNPPSALDEFHCHSWRTAILTNLEQTTVYTRLNLNQPATDVSHQSIVNLRVAVFECPATLNPNDKVPDIHKYNGNSPSSSIVGTAARSDYEAVGGVGLHDVAGPRPPYLSHAEFGAWGEPTYKYVGADIQPVKYRTARLRDISDGLSTTMLVAERAGRPNWYSSGKIKYSWPYPDNLFLDNHQAAWAISTHFSWLILGNSAVNLDNMSGLYSFHLDGANCLFADGSVRLLSTATDERTLNAMATRSYGDVATFD